MTESTPNECAAAHTLRFDYPGERTIELCLAEPGDEPARFVFGLHKCGSTLLEAVTLLLCHDAGQAFVSLPASLFQAGISDEEWTGDQRLLDAIRDGYVYLGFRTVPLFLDHCAMIRDRSRVLMVRDPRDAIVSMYFSLAYSHVVPEQETGKERYSQERSRVASLPIDAWSVDYAKVWIHQWNRVRDFLLRDRLTRVIRYEDIIFDKRRLVDEVADHLGFDPAEDVRAGIARRYDVIPDREQVTAHVRKAVPGDHVEKLRPDTIADIDEIFGEHLERFGYAG